MKPVLVIVVLVAAAVSYFTTRYGVIVDRQMIANVMQTDAAEAGDLLNARLLLLRFVLSRSII